MYIRSSATKLKSEAMFFPTMLKQAKFEVLNNPRGSHPAKWQEVHFVHKFKYLWPIITPLLNEDAEIDARVKKTKSMMGVMKSFFDDKDMDKRIKYQIYVAGPLNPCYGDVRHGA